MNRQIKFRFWGKFGELNEEKDECENEMLYGDRFCFFESEPINDLFACRNFQVMQYTGLKDKNGKEIYEGDILSDKWKVEVYQNDEGTFMVKFNTNQKVNKPMSLKKYLKAREKAGTSNCEGYRDCIVIGNIYENPELLKN